MLEFLNGNTAESPIIHWCTPGCCQNNSDAIAKVLRLTIPFFSRGFAVPLLYRFKHFAPASSFLKVGVTIHNILPRALLMFGKELDPEASSWIDTLLAPDTSKQPANAAPGALSTDDFEFLLGQLMDSDMGFNKQNSVRRKLIEKEVSGPHFSHHAVIVDSILGPFEHGVNFLFSRTSTLHELCSLSSLHPKHDELLQQSVSRFLKVVTGSLGRKLLREFMDLLTHKLHETI